MRWNSLTWPLVAQVLVVLPHLFRLPLALIIVFAVCIGVRVMVFRGQ